MHGQASRFVAICHGRMTGATLRDSGRLTNLVEVAFACPPPAAEAIARRARARRFAARAVLIRQGEQCAEAFLLLVGRAQAMLITADGRLIRLLDHAPGDMFGAIGDAGAQPAEIMAIDEVEAATFASVDFMQLAQQHACVGVLLSRSLLRQLAALSQQMLAQLTLSAVGRVQAELLRLARAGDGHSIRPAPVLAELALRVQTTRETVSRTVSMLERRGLLRREPDALVLVAPHRLEELIV